MNIDYSDLGKRVREIRKNEQLKQEGLAKRIGVTRRYLSNIENCHSIPSLETIMSLCLALNVTPNDLLMGVDSASEEYLVPDIVNRLKQCTPAEKRLIVGFVDLLEKERNR